MRITSTQNPNVRYIRSLDRVSVRRSEDAYLVEGVRLVTEALRTRQTATLALYDPDLLERSASGSLLLGELPQWAQQSHAVSRHVLEAAARTDTPAGVVAVLQRPHPEPLESHARDRLGLILDGVADPGNAGTILRAAAAFGARYIVTLPGSVDLFSPKVVRSGMGAHFRLHVYEHLEWDRALTHLVGATLVAAAAGDGDPLPSFAWPSSAALVIGSEAQGISKPAADAVRRWVHIPMQAGVESLNAAIAASILMYSAMSQNIRQVNSVTDECV